MQFGAFFRGSTQVDVLRSNRRDMVKYLSQFERSDTVIHMIPSRTVVRSAILLSATVAQLFLAAPVSAKNVSYSDMCERDVDVLQWTPQKGPIARFVADTFANSTQGGLWIGLGRAGTSFWSAEGGDTSDACDACRSLSLVETRADGTRKEYAIIDSDEYTRLSADPAARKAYVLARLWRLASRTWPADKLGQDYVLTMGEPGSGISGNQRPFAVKVATKNAFDLRYDFSASKLMCWCVYQWKVQSRR